MLDVTIYISMVLEFPILLKLGFQQNWTNHHDKIGNSINRAYIR